MNTKIGAQRQLNTIKKMKGQNLTEFVWCAVLISAVLLAMQVYTQRSLQARYKDGVNWFFSNLTLAASPRQYDPYYQGSSDKRQKHANTIEYNATKNATESSAVTTIDRTVKQTNIENITDAE